MTSLPPWYVLIALSALGAVQTACVADNRFNPSGCDVHLTGTWTVTNMDPRIDGVCDTDPSRNDVGISEVRLILFDIGTGEAWRDPEDLLLFDCNPCTDPHAQDGNEDNTMCEASLPAPPFLKSDSEELNVRRTNRCGSEGQLLAAGTYAYRWVAYSGTSEIIDCSAKAEADFLASDVELPPVDFLLGPGQLACPD